MDVARDSQDLQNFTESSCSRKRTSVGEYRKTKRGAMGVKTITPHRPPGRAWPGALVVREHGTAVHLKRGRSPAPRVRGISRYTGAPLQECV